MFRVSANIEQEISKKKKLLFISTLSSNEKSQFEPKNYENPKIISKSSSLGVPLPIPKKTKKLCNNPNNTLTNPKIIPKRILFRLYRVNFMSQKKEKGKSQNKKENNKRNGNYNIKHKKSHLQSNNNNLIFNNKNYSVGRWKSDEHQRFIDAIIRYGNNWRQVQKCVGTRSSTQTRSHAQKFFEKLKRSKIFKREKYDFSKNSLKILHDIMQNLPDKEYNQTLKALHSLSYERNSNSENEKNDIQNSNGIINYNNNIFNENKENNDENNIYDGNNNNINNEENIKCIKFCNQGYYFLENNNIKFYNSDDYLFYNSSYNINNINSISNCNNNLINDYLKFDIKSYERKESDILTHRKNSLSEMNLNIKDLKEQNNIAEDFNLECNNICNNICNNTFNINTQQDNKNSINKNFEIKDDKIEYRQFTNVDFLFNQQTSRKMSLEEK